MDCNTRCPTVNLCEQIDGPPGSTWIASGTGRFWCSAVSKWLRNWNFLNNKFHYCTSLSVHDKSWIFWGECFWATDFEICGPDFFLCVYLNTKVFENRPHTTVELKEPNYINYKNWWQFIAVSNAELQGLITMLLKL